MKLEFAKIPGSNVILNLRRITNGNELDYK